MKVPALIPFLMLVACSSSKKELAQQPEHCASSKEFITTLEYLRDRKAYSLTPKQSHRVALRVADGCNGSAGRFIKGMELLVRSGLGSADAVSIALKLAHGTDRQAEYFDQVFKMAFLRENLDLDITTSINLAAHLSSHFEGDDIEKSKKDFVALTEFCTKKENLDLPRMECARFAADLVHLNGPFKKGVAPVFLEVFEFISKKDGLARSTAEGLLLAKEVVRHGPLGAENFRTAYEYGISKKGLGLSHQGAVRFSQTLVRRGTPQKEALRVIAGSTSESDRNHPKPKPESRKGE